MSGRLAHKVALVTGATAGNGVRASSWLKRRSRASPSPRKLPIWNG